jgi:transcriptional repressor of cell division inhibition gene dicB
MLKTDVVAHFGTQQAIADALNLSKQAISRWEEIIPQGVAYRLQIVTGGVLQVNPAVYSRAAREARTAAKKKSDAESVAA